MDNSTTKIAGGARVLMRAPSDATSTSTALGLSTALPLLARARALCAPPILVDGHLAPLYGAHHLASTAPLGLSLGSCVLTMIVGHRTFLHDEELLSSQNLSR